jgi:L-ribulose-5-phosphate 3-epimerase
MKNPRLGIMQGRLSPPTNDQIQEFPVDHWSQELFKCDALGLDCVEWVYEYPTAEANPLRTAAASKIVADTLAKSSVRVNSIIADYFMEKLLFGRDHDAVKEALSVLNSLVEVSAALGIPLIELPFVDSSALVTKVAQDEVVFNLAPIVGKASEKGVKISFETSLGPMEFRELIEKFLPLQIYVNYDMGNSAALGFDPAEEIGLLGDRIVNVHIKDRKRYGGTVPLGEGATRFDIVFSELKKADYQGDFILQAARQDVSSCNRRKSPEDTINNYIDFVRPYLAQL